MRKIIVLAAAALAASCTPAMAQTVGEMVAVRAVCKDRAMVERHVKWAEEDKDYDRANKEFIAAQMVGGCITVPPGTTTQIEEIGARSKSFVDNDGDLVRLTAIRVRGFWTMHLEILTPAKQT